MTADAKSPARLPGGPAGPIGAARTAAAANSAQRFRPNLILPRLHATSRRQALQLLIEAAAEHHPINARIALDAALLRERLSGTGMGEGVAIPHARVPGLAATVSVFARLEPAVDFGAMDGLPADLVVLLLTPSENGADHLKALAEASRFLRRSETRSALREARGLEGLLTVFERPHGTDGA
jgi:PTS system nitrogen regulatory IIA component